MQRVLDELLDLSKPPPRGLFIRRVYYGVVGIARIELYSEEADAELIELIEDDIREVLGADVPQWNACLPLRA